MRKDKYFAPVYSTIIYENLLIEFNFYLFLVSFHLINFYEEECFSAFGVEYHKMKNYIRRAPNLLIQGDIYRQNKQINK